MSDRKEDGEMTVEVAKGLPDSDHFSDPADKDSLAVFCDFDGTFSVQDVGGQVAQTHLPERRAHLTTLYQKGELDAWQYALELFDGFEFSAESIEALLRTIDLDPGARDLLAWCESRGVPFQILSDGFDYNLNRLQEIHGIRFDHASNRLELEGDYWRLSPGGRNPGCTCGTGLCKRSRIEAFRQRAPSTLCIHIGNGRVSDLCGAEAADVAFAKDTLSEALNERGVSFYPFETLHDVISRMDEGFPALVP
jgi:2-hydroxy-3-keto-5-methylthiopentenyl-1-phosphate phosphatase